MSNIKENSLDSDEFESVTNRNYFSIQREFERENYFLIKRFAIDNGQILNSYPKVCRFEFDTEKDGCFELLLEFHDKELMVFSLYDLDENVERVSKDSYSANDMYDLMNHDDEVFDLLVKELKK